MDEQNISGALLNNNRQCLVRSGDQPELITVAVTPQDYFDDADETTLQRNNNVLMQQQRAVVGSFVILTIIVVTVGVLIVCLTSPNHQNKPCSLVFTPVVENSIGYYSYPLAVSVGDFNNDTWLDIVVVNHGMDNVGIFLNYENGTFANQKTYSTGFRSHPVSVAVGHVNNDYRLDIIVGNFDTNSISILFGYGDGTFANQSAFPVGASRPKSIAVGDFNNDGHLDIAVANYGTNNVGILLGYGDGSFEFPVTYSIGGSIPYSIAVGDFNNDHQLDIAVTNYDTHGISILLGYINGTFASVMTFSTGLGSYPYGIVIGDFNNDNQMDIVVANSGTDNVGIFLGYGNGSFQKQETYFVSTSSRPSYVAIGDFNNDHQLDIAVSNTGIYNISIYIGYGNGSFATKITHSINSKSNPLGIAIGDFDKDNQSDIVVANAETNSLLLLTDYATKPSKTSNTYSTGVGADSLYIVTADFNNDNYLDLAVANGGNNNVGIFLGNGNGSFESQIVYPTGDDSKPIILAIADINNDNQLDIVVANFHSDSFGLLLGYGNGTFANIRLYFLGVAASPIFVAVGDFNKDNQLDIVLANYGPNTISIVLGYANDSFGAVTTFTASDVSRPYCIAVGDVNNDGNLDLAIANAGTDSISIFLGYGNGTFVASVTYSTEYASLPQYVWMGDLNGDNLLDIVVTNTYTNNLGVFLGYGNGSFAKQITYETGPTSGPCAFALGDLNSDGHLDIAVANFYLNSVGVFLGYGNGTFASQILFPTGDSSHPTSVTIADVNNDHRLDIVSLNGGTNNIAILLGHSNTKNAYQTIYTTRSSFQNGSITSGNFQDNYLANPSVTSEKTNDIFTLLLGDYYSDFQTETIYSTGSGTHPFSIAVGDLNNDTHLDMVVINSGKGSIEILLGFGNGSFKNEINYSIGLDSRPLDVILIDFNNDNRLDMFVSDSIGNNINIFVGLGNGTFAVEAAIWTGTESQPNSLASGDFNNDNLLDVVVTNQGTDSIGLLLGFKYSSFENKAIYSTGYLSSPYSAAIGDVNNDNRLDIVVGNYATSNFAVFLGNSDGTFVLQTPQIHITGSHSWGVILGDFNNDNYLDMATVNWGINNIAVLLGYGNGTFAEPLFYSTGFASRPAAISSGDFNNDNYLDIVVTNYALNTAGIFLGYGNGTFDSVKTYSTGKLSGPSSVTIYDLNNDSYMDILTANIISDGIGILFGYGDGRFKDIQIYASDIGTSPYYAAAADFNNDAILDIAVAFYGTGDIGILLGYDNGNFSPIMTCKTGSNAGAQHLNFGDFNNDNYLDIAIANSVTGDVGILFGYGNGYFMSTTLYVNDASLGPYWILVGHFNSDIKLDLAFIDATENNLWILLQTGEKHFGSQKILLSYEGSNPSSAAVGDFNNDKCLDIVVANYGTDNIGILIGQGNGTFENMITYSTGNGSRPLAIALGDINNDSLLDIVVANSGTDNIGIFFGNYNGSFAALITYSTEKGSRPVSVAIGDLNSDQVLDIVVANFGSNNVGVFEGYGNGTLKDQTTHSVGYGGHPNKVTFGNFTNNDWMDIAVVNYDTDTVLLLSKIC
ncbi:unnamed protein product [Rotaria sp. Silwood2]|nr:unnamed protein product [Rotaria sp. Silwood2]